MRSSNTGGGYRRDYGIIPQGGKLSSVVEHPDLERAMATAELATTPPTRGYTATKDQLLKRLSRIEGQVRGVQGMVDDDRSCIDVLTQIAAVQAALDKVALGLLDGHARHCLVDDPDGKTDELMAAVARLMRRG